METINSLMAKLLAVGLVATLGLILIGGIKYVLHHSQQIINYHTFRPSFALISVTDSLKKAASLEAVALIQVGLLLLVFVQILRIAMTACYFATIKDRIFTAMTLFILFMVLISFK